MHAECVPMCHMAWAYVRTLPGYCACATSQVFLRVLTLRSFRFTSCGYYMVCSVLVHVYGGHTVDIPHDIS